MSNLYIARSRVITIFPIMSRHATSTTSWGRIRISIIHFLLKSLALFPIPFIFHTLLSVPETWIGDLTMSNFHCFVSVPVLLKFARMWRKQNR
ncbi:hypothetical protein M9H77_09323 [Catharanthus roseus]|uniref:Uncharacterized protein n=1 Tax=Catharanthus roseus TaxID=4058 RepID=A0ACC0C0T8_CATRO|nr:hypothetical protein M9H77_09323 [Catharanthus roseus]